MSYQMIQVELATALERKAPVAPGMTLGDAMKSCNQLNQSWKAYGVFYYVKETKARVKK